MSKEAMLAAIRRGLRRGPLPDDQATMLRGRLASHPRHLIPARSRLAHAEQVALFAANVEKEFGSVARVPDLDAVPEAVAAYLASQNLPSDIVIAPHQELQTMPWHERPLLRLREGRAEASDAVSVTGFRIALAAWLVFNRNDTNLGGTNGLTDFKQLIGYRLSDPATQRGLYILTVLCLGGAYLLCRWIIRLPVLCPFRFLP